MSRRPWRSLAIAAVTVTLGSSAFQAAVPKYFRPDHTFTGSSLTGWRTVGRAEWRATNGAITGRTGAGGGWLVLDRAYQDVGFHAGFQCAGSCGVLLRAESQPDGGMKGVYVSLTAGDLASYRVTVDRNGAITSRERLRAAPTGQVRFAPPPPPASSTPPAGGRGGGRGGGGAAAVLPPLTVTGGIPAPIPRPDPSLKPNDWNTIELTLDANILRPLINTIGGIAGGTADEDFVKYGAIALHADGGDATFKDIAYANLRPRRAPAELVSSRFKMQVVHGFYTSWGPDIADVDRDGAVDIVAGGVYYRGPSFEEGHEIYLNLSVDPSTQYFNGQQYARDFTGDGWPDVVHALFNRPVVMYINPKGEARRWDMVTVTDRMSSELALIRDIDGDGREEFIFKDDGNQIVAANPDPANVRGMWKKRALTEAGAWPNHGLGLGDVNGDRRVDLLDAFGWWEQPAGWKDGLWTYHPAAFGRWDRASPGGAEMGVYDVNGDGLNDVVTSLQAHGWGLSWFEQKRSANGAISFVEHSIMGDFSTKNAGDVTFSEPHGSAFADVDGDGLLDFITGKRFFSHLDSFVDPDPYGPPVLYVYRTVRNPRAPGGAEFVPELVHNRSGIGSAAAVFDLDKDGAPEIITSTKLGTFVYWNRWRQNASRAPAR